MEDWYSLPGFHQPMSSISHLAGAVLFLILGIFLIVSARRDSRRFISCSIFAFSAVMLLSLSGVFHMFKPGFVTRSVMIRLDVAAIFILIAGTFTPLHTILFRGWKSWGILVLIWVVAVTGVTLRTIFFDNLPIIWGTAIFLLMGWVGLLSTFMVVKSYGRRAAVPIILGGLFYTVGAVGDAIRWPVLIPNVWGPHETFHLFVLAGLGTHWHLVAKIAEGKLNYNADA